MSTPTYATVLSQINTFIVANGDNEITANVLNPILKYILDFSNNNIGDLQALTTSEKENIVESINSLKQAFDNLSNNGVQLFTGINNPNDIPPATYNYADFYMQLDVDDLPVKLWQFNGFDWIDLISSSVQWGSITGTLSDQSDLQSALNSKENTIASGTTAQYYRGDKTWQTLDTSSVPEGSRQYFTNQRVILAPLDGFTVLTDSPLAESDLLIGGLGKVQGQINARAPIAYPSFTGHATSPAFITQGGTTLQFVDGTGALQNISTIKIYKTGELCVFKNPANTNQSILEAGDMVTGIVQGMFINASYLGGDTTLLASFDIVNQTEI